MESLQGIIGPVSEFQYQVAIAGLFLAVLYLWRKRQIVYIPKTIEDITMTPEGRRLYVRRRAMEAICDGLLNEVIDGHITDDEANGEMARLAKLYGHEEMIPLIRSKKTPMLKAQLKNNERRRFLNKKLNGHGTDPLPIPEPSQIKPQEETIETIESILKGKAL